MKKIFIRKVFPYEPTFNGKYSRYQGYCLSALQKESPSIKTECSIMIEGIVQSPIYCSSLKRGQETAACFGKKMGVTKIFQTPHLNEVLFDLKNLVSEEEYRSLGSNLVRKQFIQAFIEDRLLESRSNLEKRINFLFEDLNKLKGGNYLLISHSFFMKILQVYLKDGQLFNHPEILKVNFDYQQKTFEFGEGFEFNL